MKLTEISYSEYRNTDSYWTYYSYAVNNVNLIVGKNASGKSRMLSSIRGLGLIFTNLIAPFRDGNYDATLVDDDNKKYKYSVSIVNGVVKSEQLLIDETIYITRLDDGTGFILGEESSQNIKFKIPKNQLVVSKRDELQHPALKKLHTWGKALRLFKFAQDEEKSLLVGSTMSNVLNKNNENSLLAIKIFQDGKSEFKSEYVNAVIRDMNEIGYNIESITIGKMEKIKIISSPFPTELSGIILKERDCKAEINQINMSDGMFRALAILIHFNYFKFKKAHGTILIDDIGEGLDYERSIRLIKILIENSEDRNIQLIMATNNKFVMNSIKLDYWQVISRKGSEVNIYNIHNSKEKFDDFKFTGLNNFDFFSSNFLFETEE
jgi:energy-coupling factor transporter ATP-binding protein EcfA2